MGNERADEAQPDGINLDALPRWLRDLIDINNEMADRDTGRVKRFLADDSVDGPESEKRKEERRFSELMRLLQNPVYAALYQDVANAIGDAERLAARAMDNLARDGEIASRRLDDLKDSAAQLPDGRKVFRSSDGRLYAEDGTDVTDQRASVTGLSEQSPSWEEFQRAKHTLEDIERRKREIEDYLRDVVNPAKRRLGDPDNPPSKEELEEIWRRLKEAQPADLRALQEQKAAGPAAEPPGTAREDVYANAPDAEVEIAASDAGADAPMLATAKSAADEYTGDAEMNVPDIFAHFRAVSSVVSGEAYASQATPLPATGPKFS